jgi:hypothetical protein
VVPAYQTTTCYVPEDYNIKKHANSALVTPLIIAIIVSRTFLLTAGCAVVFFLPILLLCESICCLLFANGRPA